MNRDEVIRATDLLAAPPVSATVLEARYKRRATTVASIAKWPAIGALIGGGVLIIGRIFGPPLVDQLGAQAGEGFARGMYEAREKIAQVQRQLNISGWGTYQR